MGWEALIATVHDNNHIYVSIKPQNIAEKHVEQLSYISTVYI